MFQTASQSSHQSACRFRRRLMMRRDVASIARSVMATSTCSSHGCQESGASLGSSIAISNISVVGVQLAASAQWWLQAGRSVRSHPLFCTHDTRQNDEQEKRGRETNKQPQNGWRLLNLEMGKVLNTLRRSRHRDTRQLTHSIRFDTSINEYFHSDAQHIQTWKTLLG